MEAEQEECDQGDEGKGRMGHQQSFTSGMQGDNDIIFHITLYVAKSGIRSRLNYPSIFIFQYIYMKKKKCNKAITVSEHLK